MLRRLGYEENDHLAFYTAEPAKEIYRSFATAVAERYANRSTVMAYNLMNEPRCPVCGGPGALDAWVSEMAPAVKAACASNCLVTVGLEGFFDPGSAFRDANPAAIGCRRVPEDECGPGKHLWAETTGTSYETNHVHEAVDFATFHLWLRNWNVRYEGCCERHRLPSTPEDEACCNRSATAYATRETGDAFARRWVQAHVDAAASAFGSKPVVLEEVHNGYAATPSDGLQGVLTWDGEGDDHGWDGEEGELA